MSNLWAETYDVPVGVTESDTVDDPAGPFAGLYCGGAGNVVVWPLNGTGSVTMAVVAGGYLRFPIRRVGATSTTATGLFGLRSSIVQQQQAGAKL
jgi:hypothetical protein